MAAQSLIDNTLQVWQPYYDHSLTREDGTEIVSNWAAYVGLISEWTATYQNRPQEVV